MTAKLSRMGRALLLGPLIGWASVTGAAAQDFSKLQCPTLTELRMELLVRHGYCPRDRFYARMFSKQVEGCDPTLSDLQVQDKILNSPDTPEADKERYEKLLRFLQRNNCEI
ncbi:hypothetical protein [Dichotomicrobium thermohalophilum]|uniref:YARHG domain-containing protein n=1 Tax=Dichotomicrobium thermohalophilum TaxID=933063 RepID=A0A397Q4E4_9HYPH|nr:hypothetical protein [Dichotomicrobium thermohalophilum]RIA55289.1 hypothetical protein BXY53_0350 [Dichotomicrobium thermohalophilum]